MKNIKFGMVLVLALHACKAGEKLDASTNSGPTRSLVKLEHEPAGASPKTITVTVTNYCPTGGRTLGAFIVRNLTTITRGGRHIPDQDFDGIADQAEGENEEAFGLNQRLFDSNGDGYADGPVFWAGIDKASQSNLRCSDPARDTDGDGLTDCEEDLTLKTDPKKIDSDGDGIPDLWELRSRTNPKDPIDASLDPDGDGVRNSDEIKFNTPIDEDNRSKPISQLAYKYTTSADPHSGSGCLKIAIENVGLMYEGSGEKLDFYLREVLQDNSESHYGLAVNLEPSSAGKIVALDFRMRFKAL